MALFAAATPSVAQVAIGREFPLVPGSTTSALTWPSVAVAPSGDFVVTFVRHDGPFRRIVSRHYDALGAPQGGESTVASGVSSHAISATGPSGFVVVWPAFDGYRPTVFARRLDPQGIPAGASFIPPSGTGEGDMSPSVSGDPNGGFVVVWATATVAGSPNVVSGRRYAADGTPVGAEFRISDGTLQKRSTAVAVAGDGTFVVGWGDYHYSMPSRAVVRRFDAAGSPLTPEVVVNPSNSSPSGTTSNVATDFAGNFAVVWKENTIKARWFQADGTPVTGDVPVTDGLLDGDIHVAGDAAGNVIVTWTEMRGLAEDVRGRRIGASAAPGPIFRVSSHDRQYNMGGALSMNADGRAIVAWDSTTDPNHLGLPMARRYGPR
jgi:hypothetical protein